MEEYVATAGDVLGGRNRWDAFPDATLTRTAYISEPRVKSHIRSILGKLPLASRVRIVAHAYENGLVR